jgi:Fe-S-cluster-containing dehydrogenase component
VTANKKKAKREGKEFPILVYPEKCTGCRTCQIRCSIRYLGEFNPFRSYVVVARDHGKRTTALDFTDDCTWCGYCARFCAYGALVLKKSVKSGKGDR